MHGMSMMQESLHFADSGKLVKVAIKLRGPWVDIPAVWIVIGVGIVWGGVRWKPQIFKIINPEPGVD